MLEQTNKHSWLNAQTDLTQFHKVSLCLCVADPATFLASNSVLGTTLFTIFRLSLDKTTQIILQ